MSIPAFKGLVFLWEERYFTNESVIYTGCNASDGDLLQ